MNNKDSKKRKADLEKFLSLLKEKRLEKEQKEREKPSIIQKPVISKSSLPQKPHSSQEDLSPSSIQKKPQKKSDVLLPVVSSDELAILDAPVVLDSLVTSTSSTAPSVVKTIISSKSDYLSIVYIYDIFAKDKKSFNRTKRLFYYYLNKLPLSKNVWKTKSTIAVSPSLEKTMDSFFSRFGSRLIVYKICAHTIEQLE